jgi:Flp pilus assembly protein TadG
MQTSSLKGGRRRGSTLLLFTLMVSVLVLFAGLAVDASMLYIAQGQLQTAVDGAASGAVRLVSSDANEPEIISEFVKANMPTGFWWSSGLQVSNATVTSTETTATSNVTATATVPLLFMRLLGTNSASISAAGSEQRRVQRSDRPARVGANLCASARQNHRLV